MAATGRAARADRLNERLRGAQRVNIADDDFGLDLGAFDDAPDPSTSPDTEPRPEPDPEPSSSVKRRKLDNSASAPVRQSPRSRRSPYALSETSRESVRQNRSSPVVSGARVARSARHVVAPAATEPDPDDLESLPPPSSVQRSQQSPVVVRDRVVEEIAESPADRPGSGQRRPIQSAVASSSRLQGALRSDSVEATNSSPTTYKSRRSDALSVVRSTRSVRQSSLRQTPSRSPQDDVDELSPDQPPDLPSVAEETPSREPVGDQATAVGDAEAAAALGGRRRRPGRPVASPELGSRDGDEAEDEPDPEPVQPRRKRPRPSPAKQKQGGPRPKPGSKSKTATAQSKAKSKQKRSPKRKRRSSNEDEGDTNAIELTVQRFVNHKKREGDPDPLQLEIPFANRSGESVTEVFAAVCDEVIANTIAQFQGVIDGTSDAARKKEFRIKIRAVEAYKETLSARLLEHTIRLNHWHSLRKRVRHAQKEKLALREEIMELKREREQVALRMDAVRIKHEADTKESNSLLDMSATMRDIDLAAASGREAPALSAKANKEAELANLELAVAQIADQASSTGPMGGLLSQIKDFNGLLERAAVALESRRDS